MTDGNTYAINKHLNDQEDYDALQEVTAELEQAEARIEELEATLQQERSAKWEVLESPFKLRVQELEAKLAKAVKALEQIASHRKKCHEYDDDVGHERREFDVEDMIIMEYAARTTLAELSSVSCANLKGQDDG